MTVNKFVLIRKVPILAIAMMVILRMDQNVMVSCPIGFGQESPV